MTVKELITFLETFDPELEVVYSLYSEQAILEPDEIHVQEFCEARVDGWVQDHRPDMPKKKYLSFPGN